MQEKRNAADQRRALVETVRASARWRRSKVDEFHGDDHAQRQNRRAALALRTLANFIDELPDDDLDLSLEALARIEESDGRLALTEDASALLSRFGLDYGAWQSDSPSEKQMRNVLRRIDGIEARERRARRERAERGYGDD